MPGTVVETHGKRGPIGVVTLTCVGDAADGSFPETALAVKISGRIVALETNPGATAPTDNWDVALDDAEGDDVLQTLGANRDTVNTEKVAVVYSGTSLHVPVAMEDVLTLKITGNSVNSANIKIRILYEGAFE